MTRDVFAPPGDRRFFHSIILELTEGVILVEADGRISWANRAALAMHAVARIEDLGGSLHGYYARFQLSYRNNHALKESEYPGHRAVGGEAIRDVIVNVAPRGQAPVWMHKVRTLALDAGDDAAGSCAIIIDDATEEEDAERRFEAAFDANPAPAIICRLDDKRYIKVNEGFLEMTGYTREALIGHGVQDIDVLENAERRDLALMRLDGSRPIPQMEARLRLPSGGAKAVIVAGQPIEIARQPCMLFTFIDLEHRKKAEKALVQRGERFCKAFRLAPVAMLISTLAEFRILDANDAFVSEFGHGRASAVGRTKAELALWTDVESQEMVEKFVRETGRVQAHQLRLRSRDGSVAAYRLSSETMSVVGEDCILTVIQNVDEDRRQQRQILAAVEAALQDTSWLGQKILEKIKSVGYGDQVAPASATVSLSPRQREILTLVAKGESDTDIAAHFEITRSTVRNHLHAIYAALNLHNRGDAIIWAREHGLLRPR